MKRCEYYFEANKEIDGKKDLLSKKTDIALQ